ncbi:transposase [Streptomyces sp. NPDC101062]|uniref:transposase n=1 Tax=unclassified Streptomyces TaxID=2593676 RepID=UPI00381562D9
MLFRARTEAPWPDLPEEYGPWQTVHERHRRWSADGAWQAVLQESQIEAGQGACRRVSRRGWAVDIDSTSCRAHQHVSGAPANPRRTTPTRRRGA